MPLVTENFFPLSPALPFFFSPLQWCVAAITDNGRNIKGNEKPPAASWAQLKRTDATCILQKSCLLHVFSTWLRVMLNANAVVGESVCVLSWAGALTQWLWADLLNLKGKKKESLHVLAWSNIASIFLDFTYRDISVELYLAMLSSVCNLCSLLCNLLFQAIMS